MRQIKFRAWNGVMHPKWLDIDNPTGFILMQFTGLKDKNDREIYEGDIIETNYIAGMGRGAVSYIFSEFVIKKSFWVESLTDLVKNKWSLEIMGNIYENPELLEVENEL